MFSSISIALALIAVSADNNLRQTVFQQSSSAHAENIIDTTAEPIHLAPVVKDDAGTCLECDDCSNSHSCQHGRWHLNRCKTCQRLPSARFSTGDMPLHIPYIAQPQSYYYFRPYNHLHIRQQQQEVSHYGGDIRNPYDNRFFDNLYNELPSGTNIEQIDKPKK